MGMPFGNSLPMNRLLHQLVSIRLSRSPSAALSPVEVCVARLLHLLVENCIEASKSVNVHFPSRPSLLADNVAGKIVFDNRDYPSVNIGCCVSDINAIREILKLQSLSDAIFIGSDQRKDSGSILFIISVDNTIYIWCFEKY